jgi:colanic acid/amylovoran biosynthesis glycosyltransferase
MKVAYILSMFPCWSETFILREIVELQRRGVDITILSLKPCNEQLVQPDAQAIVDQGRVIVLPWGKAVGHLLLQAMRHPFKLAGLVLDFTRTYRGSLLSYLKSVATLALGAAFIPELRRRGIEHIHAPWGTYPSTAALLCARLAGTRFSFTTRAHDLFLEDHGLELKFREAAFAQTITAYNQRVLTQRYPHLVQGSLHVIHSALVPEVFDIERQPVSPPLVLSVGRMVEMKGFADLVAACALLRDQGQDFQCRIVGEGPLQSVLQAQIDQLHLRDHVSLLPPVAQTEIRRLLSQATCFVLPCVTAADGDQDGIPNVLTEALAARVPAISCPTSGVPELIENGVTGLMVPQREPPALAEAIRRLLDDPTLQQQLASAGRDRVEAEFNIHRNAARMGELMAHAAQRPRRVVLIIDELERGGAQRQILELALGLSQLKVAVQVIYFRSETAQMLDAFADAGVQTLLVRKRRAIDLPFVWRLRRALVWLKPDVVQTYTATADLWGRAAALAAGVPVIVSAARTDLMSASMKLLDPFTTAFTANSEAVRDSVVRRGVAAHKIRVIPNGIQLERYRRRATRLADDFVVGTVARLDEQKNLSCLIQAAALLRDKGLAVRIEIAGDGPMERALKDEAAALRLSQQLVFLGARDDVPALLQTWQAAVLPSWHEGLSNFLMEAMAAGLPIAASDIPANRELLAQGTAGRLFPPTQPDALAAILLDFAQRPDAAKALGEAAALAISPYSVEQMCQRHLQLYQEHGARVQGTPSRASWA